MTVISKNSRMIKYLMGIVSKTGIRQQFNQRA